MATSTELLAQLAALEAENAQLKATQGQVAELTMKVSEKGAVSVSGMGRFPTTLYAGQWDRLLSNGMPAKILQFIVDNKGKLSYKS